MNLFHIFLINTIMIPVTAGIDYLAFHNRWEKENPGKKMEWHYFLPACFLELTMFNAGIWVGITL